jgi:methyl acetate hydrolase
MTTDAVDEVLQQAVNTGAVPNVVAIAADRNGPFYEGAAGPRVAGGDEPVSADTHYRIMSMTKMVATAAALQQVEQGRLDLDSPVEQYCPEFGELQVLDGFDGETPVLRSPRTKATVKQLITHTSGLGYWFWNADLLRWETATGTPNVLSGSNVIFAAPLLADPVTRFEYGINTDWLGKVVEATSGTTFDVAIKEGITGPLGMHETTFWPSADHRKRLVPIHVRGEDGSWVPSEIELHPEPEYCAGGHGLYSTPRDYLRFQRALLGYGEVEGTRILQEATVRAAFTNQIGDIDFPVSIPTADPSSTADFTAGPDHKWGYGLLLNTEDMLGRRRAGSGSWAGLCNTHFWVDHTTGITGAIYTQTLPFVAPEVHQVYVDFETALYAAL